MGVLRNLWNEVTGKTPDWLIEIQDNKHIDRYARYRVEELAEWERAAVERIHAQRAIQAARDAKRQALLEQRAQSVADNLQGIRELLEEQQRQAEMREMLQESWSDFARFRSNG